MIINDFIISDYFACRYKEAGTLGLVPDLKPIFPGNQDFEVEYRNRAIEIVLEKYPTFKKVDPLHLDKHPKQKKESVVGLIILTGDGLQCHLDGLV